MKLIKTLLLLFSAIVILLVCVVFWPTIIYHYSISIDVPSGITELEKSSPTHENTIWFSKEEVTKYEIKRDDYSILLNTIIDTAIPDLNIQVVSPSGDNLKLRIKKTYLNSCGKIIDLSMPNSISQTGITNFTHKIYWQYCREDTGVFTDKQQKELFLFTIIDQKYNKIGTEEVYFNIKSNGFKFVIIVDAI